MNEHTHRAADLTKNQTLVMGTLAASSGPMSAYTILDELRGEGFRAPLQVYRALGKLVEFGLVHRLESLNSFVACRHPDCDEHQTMAFMICDGCGQVNEITDASLARRLQSLAKDSGFALSKTTIELRGLCETCQAG
jgi:Fur family transcriptional regulator, zinc uptake regulator